MIKTIAIAKKAEELAYSLHRLVRDLNKGAAKTDWIIPHGMCVGLQGFCDLLLDRKLPRDEYQDALYTVRSRLLDIRCMLDEDGQFYCPKAAEQLAEMVYHVIYRISTGRSLNQKYITLCLNNADKFEKAKDESSSDEAS